MRVVVPMVRWRYPDEARFLQAAAKLAPAFSRSLEAGKPRTATTGSFCDLARRPEANLRRYPHLCSADGAVVAVAVAVTQSNLLAEAARQPPQATQAVARGDFSRQAR